ncbi:MAG: ammonia channel protein [Pleurocapsa sp. SU_196_0]|nr:ammonia channel protein [Pleurocapsa sp. SU_196_0]
MKGLKVGLTLATALSSLAVAQDAAPFAPNSGDTAWLLVSSALVMLMTPGLAFFYGGLVRAKSALNTMMMSYIALGVVAIVWALLGYSIAFSHKDIPNLISGFVGGTSFAFLNGVDGNSAHPQAGSIPHNVFMIFQAMFAVITPALISGAIVERMKFKTYVVFIALWSLLIYAPLAHMVWSNDGFLFKLGALDFAGGTVVHISAGISALVAAIILGPRRGFGRVAMAPHNVPFVLIGAGLLWFGWFGFNAGSALASMTRASPSSTRRCSCLPRGGPTSSARASTATSKRAPCRRAGPPSAPSRDFPASYREAPTPYSSNCATVSPWALLNCSSGGSNASGAQCGITTIGLWPGPWSALPVWSATRAAPCAGWRSSITPA